MSRNAIETFFRTLLLGDFEEDQNTAAQIVGGLISLVPGLDQVMDARDISGALFNINKRGGFANASPDQLVNLGFAAFGRARFTVGCKVSRRSWACAREARSVGFERS
jgi:hypothetical protein